MREPLQPRPMSKYISVIKKTDRRTYSGNIVWEVKCCCGRQMFWSRRQILDYYSCGCKSAEIRFDKVWKGCGEISGEIFSGIRRNAYQRKLKFEITVQDVWNKFIEQNRKCALSGEALHFGTEFDNPTASLDRIDSTKGYTIDNVQWLHKKVNFMKQQFEQEDFINWCEKVVKHSKGVF